MINIFRLNKVILKARISKSLEAVKEYYRIFARNCHEANKINTDTTHTAKSCSVFGVNMLYYYIVMIIVDICL